MEQHEQASVFTTDINRICAETTMYEESTNFFLVPVLNIGEVFGDRSG